MSDSKYIDKKNKPTVLFVMHMPPPIHGASVVGQYIRESELINNAFDCRYIDITTAKNLEDIGKADFRKMGMFFKKLFQVVHAIIKKKPSIVYMTPCTTGGPFFKDSIMLSVAKLTALFCSWKTKFVIHLHNKGVLTMQNSWVYNLLYRIYFCHLKVILLGESLYNDVSKYVGRENVLICPNGIPDTNLEPEKKDYNEVPRILWLSHIMRTKGLIEYLDALRLLKERGLHFVADFVGGVTGEITQPEFEDEIEMRGLSDIVEYHGNKFGRKKEDFLRNADIFILPSYTEAFPLTILEAMQYSLPVVASNVGGISNQVKEGVSGFLVGGAQPIMENTFRPNPNEIAAKLELLLQNPDLRVQMGKEGRLRYERKFTLSVFEDNFKNTLMSLFPNK